MKRSIQSAVALAVVVCVAGFAAAQTIDDIQYYNPTTGAPASPYNGTTQTVEGRIYVLKGTYNAGTHYILDDAGNGIAFFNSSATALASSSVSTRMWRARTSISPVICLEASS